MEKVTNEALAHSIDDLARMTKRGFDHVNERFEQVDKRFEQVDKRFEQVDKRFDKVDMELSHMNARLSRVESDVADIKRDIIDRNEFDDLMGRVKYLELKLGIESGK